jgi:hypothetical protein
MQCECRAHFVGEAHKLLRGLRFGVGHISDVLSSALRDLECFIVNLNKHYTIRNSV